MPEAENQKPTWLNIRQLSIANSENINKELFESDEIEAIQLSKLFHFSEMRTAYYGYDSNQDYGNYSYHFDINVIKKEIEAYRKMGSSFSIYEIPCIAIKGKTYSIVIAPRRSRDKIPFSIFETPEQQISSEVKTIKQLYDQIEYICRGGHIDGFILDTVNVNYLESPLIRYTSVSYGPRYYLSYLSNKRNQPHLDHILDLYSYLHKFVSAKFLNTY